MTRETPSTHATGGPGLQVEIAYGRTGHTRVRLEGELDIAGLPRLRRVMLALLEDCVRVVVDLGKLRFVDVPGVRLLVEVAAAAAGRECPFELEGASGQVARVIDLTSAHRLLPLAS